MNQQQLNKIKKIALAQIKTTSDPPHGITHIKTVINNSKKIVKLLKLTNQDIDLNLLTAVCYLHDLSYADHKPGLKTYIMEGKIAQDKARKILEGIKQVNTQDKKIILDAMLYHVHSFPFPNFFSSLNPHNNIYTKILQDADTLDNFRPKRVAQFKNQKNYPFPYPLFQKLTPFFIKYGRKNISKYLNFPISAQILND